MSQGGRLPAPGLRRAPPAPPRTPRPAERHLRLPAGRPLRRTLPSFPRKRESRRGQLRPAARPSTSRTIAHLRPHLRKSGAAKTRRGSQDAYYLPALRQPAGRPGFVECPHGRGTGHRPGPHARSAPAGECVLPMWTRTSRAPRKSRSGGRMQPPAEKSKNLRRPLDSDNGLWYVFGGQEGLRAVSGAAQFSSSAVQQSSSPAAPSWPPQQIVRGAVRTAGAWPSDGWVDDRRS